MQFRATWRAAPNPGRPTIYVASIVAEPFRARRHCAVFPALPDYLIPD